MEGGMDNAMSYLGSQRPLNPWKGGQPQGTKTAIPNIARYIYTVMSMSILDPLLFKWNTACRDSFGSLSFLFDISLSPLRSIELFWFRLLYISLSVFPSPMPLSISLSQSLSLSLSLSLFLSCCILFSSFPVTSTLSSVCLSLSVDIYVSLYFSMCLTVSLSFFLSFFLSVSYFSFRLNLVFQ